MVSLRCFPPKCCIWRRGASPAKTCSRHAGPSCRHSCCPALLARQLLWGLPENSETEYEIVGHNFRPTGCAILAAARQLLDKLQQHAR